MVKKLCQCHSANKSELRHKLYFTLGKYCVIGLNLILLQRRDNSIHGSWIQGLGWLRNTFTVPFIICWLPWLPISVVLDGVSMAMFIPSPVLHLWESFTWALGFSRAHISYTFTPCGHLEKSSAWGRPSVPRRFTPRHNDRRLEPYQGLVPLVT